MLLKEVKYPRMNEAEWEEVPDEDLWKDGELSGADLLEEIYQKVIIEGNWKLIREIE